MRYAITGINYTGFRKKQKLIEQKIKQQGAKTIQDLCKLGKAHAKSIAPFYSGTLVGAISYKTNKGTSGEVYIKNIKEPTWANNGYDTTHKLSKWMHQTGGVARGRKWIRSGSPTFMYRTKDYMNKIKTSVAKGHFDKIKIQ